jgi:magnesium transporter
MILETEHENVKENFLEIIGKEDLLETREFLNSQNISDVASLIYDLPEHASKIISNMSIHRAASVFKILDFPTQKTIIQELPPYKTE